MKTLLLLGILSLVSFNTFAEVIITCDVNGNCEPVIIFPPQVPPLPIA